MAPQVNLFKAWMIWMKIAGADPPSVNFPYALALLWKLIMLYGSVHYVIIMFLAIVVGDRAFHLKLEAGLFLLAGIPCSYKHFVFVIRKNKLHEVIDRLNTLLEEVEDVYGTETLAGWQRICNMVMYFYSTQFTMLVVPVFSFFYYIYYWEGVEATPYEVYIPFEKENHIHRVMLYELLSFLGPAAGLITGNIFFGSLTVAVSGVLRKIQEQFSQLSPSNEQFLLHRTIRWHSEIISIVGETNRLLGTVFVVEYLLAMVYICFSGYMLLKVGSATEDVNLNKNIILCIVCIVMPLFYCLCGHVIVLEYDKMSDSIFQNDWVSLQPVDRKKLILPALLAKRGLSLHYKKLLKFDMTTYLKIVKQSYSFLTMLKLMENT
uniref:Odorant receptor n=1 Tax=Apolygus lucorum TaxID=248454 RepID=A0A7T8G3Q5_APOLU|nr:olfactory receptor 58 [Apolygus lucorum]